MTRVVRAAVIAVVGIGMWAASAMPGRSAGAMAVGACAAYGYAYDYRSADAARAAAAGKCHGANCKVVMMLHHSCGAFAIDGHRPCGPNGYASARQLGEAENVALKSCYKYGGHDCVIRAFACDVKG
jgi:hypothetical protein